jgi:hypothetical protein
MLLPNVLVLQRTITSVASLPRLLAAEHQDVGRTSMNSSSELFALLDGLVEGWCQRRALRPLRILLPAYPMASTLSDSWHELRGALRSLRTLREPDVTDSEAAAIEDGLRAVDMAIGVSNWKLTKL